MAIHYSASRHTFLDDRIHDLPADAVPVTRARHRALLDAQGSGATIVADDKGHPRISRPRVTSSILREQLTRAVKREAARRIEAIAPLWRQLNDLRARGPGAEPYADWPQDVRERFLAIDAVRAASGAIEDDIATLSLAALKALDVAGHPAWPEAR